MTAPFIEKTPFPDQVLAIDNIRAAFRSFDRVCFRAPTGFGKTFVFTYIGRRLAMRDIRLGIIVHREELVQQIREALGVPHGVIQGGKTPNPYLPIQVCSIQTLARRPQAHSFDWLIWDEAHHCSAAQYGIVRRANPTAKHLGVTATPFRLDGRGLDECFDTLVCGPTVPELIQAGRLCPGVAYSHPSTISREGIRKGKDGELNQKQLGERANDKRLIGDMVDHYRQRCGGTPAVLFAVNREHSKACAQAFCDAGYKFVHVDATTDEATRKAAFQGLKSGSVDGVCNVNLVAEGFDVPHLVTVIDAQPGESLANHIQKIGRGARVAPGKDVFYYLDHAGNINRHLFAPNMDLEDFSLQGEPKKRIGAAGPVAIVTQCPSCYRSFEARGECPYCGFIPEAKGRKIEHIAGELERVDTALLEAERKKLGKKKAWKPIGSENGLEKLLEVQQARGYKDGWVAMQIQLRRKNKFQARWGGEEADAFLRAYAAQKEQAA